MSPTLIHLPDALKLLKISVFKSSKPTSQFKFLVGKNNRDIQLDFDYLEPKQGVNIELLVTGDGEKPSLSVVVLGMPSGFQHYVPEQTNNLLAGAGFLIVFLGDFHFNKAPII